MMRIARMAACVLLLPGCRATDHTGDRPSPPDKPVAASKNAVADAPHPTTAKAEPLPDCEWCGTAEAPENLTWDIQIAADDEPGERMVLEGTVVHEDGSPAGGVVLYLYHTDAQGEYSQQGDETGNGRRHGHLRGWLRTDENGHYRVRTIRPAPYPGRHEAAHVHVTIDDGAHPEYWLDSFKFASDPLLTDEDRNPDPGRGGLGIIELEQDESGVWRGTRTIVLPDDPPPSPHS